MEKLNYLYNWWLQSETSENKHYFKKTFEKEQVLVLRTQ